MSFFQEHDTSDSNQNCIKSHLQSSICPRLLTSISCIFGAMTPNWVPSNFQFTIPFIAFSMFFSVKVESEMIQTRFSQWSDVKKLSHCFIEPIFVFLK